MTSVLGLIPARGGSKGIPRKNIRPLNGKPLLQYTAEVSLAARCLTQVILSTDDTEIAEAGFRFGLEVPFMRPADLSADDTPMLLVVQHALRCMEEQGDHFDAVCLLQPTNPLRKPHDIDACIELLATSGADSVVTTLPVPEKYNPHWVYFESEDGTLRLSTGGDAPIPRRQALPPAYHREGSVYVTRRDIVMRQNSLYGDTVAGHLLDPHRSVNLDDMNDWRRAEELLSQEDSRQTQAVPLAAAARFAHKPGFEY